jgi:DNA polymerase-3 subunit alpha
MRTLEELGIEKTDLVSHNHCATVQDAVCGGVAMCKGAQNAGYSAIAITDHGNFCGMQDCLDYAANTKGAFKVIYGLEGYLNYKNKQLNENNELIEDNTLLRNRHILWLAKDEQGKHLIDKVNAQADLYRGVPSINFEDIKQLSGGHIICQTACIASPAGEYLLHNYNLEHKKSLKKTQRKIKTDTVETIPVHDKEPWTQEEMYEKAKNYVKELQDIFGEDLFVEIQYHGLEQEKIVYPQMVKIAKELNLPLVITNDAHMPDNSRKSINQRKVAVYKRYKNAADDEEREDANDEMYIKSQEELANFLLDSGLYDIEDIREGFHSLNVINERCTYEQKIEDHAPKYVPSETEKKEDGSFDSKEKLREIAMNGLLNWRFKNGFPDEETKKKYIDRLNYELDVICNMGYADYFLIVKDFLEYGRVIAGVPKDKMSEVPLTIEEAKIWCEEHHHTIGFGIGVGRGSGAGSLVAYTTGITGVDPIPFDLIFERFLNPQRITMPDIDSDLAMYVREKCVEYVIHKYGEKNVVGIQTKAIIHPKKGLSDAKIYLCEEKGWNAQETQKLVSLISKEIPNLVNWDSKVDPLNPNSLTYYQSISDKFKDTPHAKELIDLSYDLEGSLTSLSVHAAGKIIFDNSYENGVIGYTPTTTAKKDNQKVIEMDMSQAEHAGLLKMDFLGLRTLNIITEAKQLIFRERKEDVDVTQTILQNDEKCVEMYKLFLKAETGNIFQFNSTGMKQTMQQLFDGIKLQDITAKKMIDWLTALNALYRPGPMDEIPNFMKNRNGIVIKLSEDKRIEDIVSVTNGIIVYQEQVMRICTDCAGFSMGEADNIRKFMSKKKPDKIAEYREYFIYGNKEKGIKGCVNNGMSEKDAIEIYDKMTAFASYAFNKSHALVYALTAMYCMYLKANYPAEYLCACLNWVSGTKADIQRKEAIADIHKMGVELVPPDINNSNEDTDVKNGKIIYGLNMIKNINSISDILAERKENGVFINLKDFLIRTKPNKKVFESLMYAGALDKIIGFPRQNLFENITNSETKPYEQLLEIVGNYKDSVEKLEALNKALRILHQCNGMITIEEFQEKCISAGIAASSFNYNTKKVPAVSKLEDRRDNIRNAIYEYDRQLSDFIEELSERNVPETNVKVKEYEMLGHFINHPLQGIPTLEFINDEGKSPNKLTGILTDVKVNVSKKSGQKYMTATLSDELNSIDVIVFGNAIQKIEQNNKLNLLTNVSAVTLTGNLNIEENEVDTGEYDEDGNSITTMEYKRTFFVNDVERFNIKSLNKKSEMFLLNVPSRGYYESNLKEYLKSKSVEKDGLPLTIVETGYDKVNNKTYHNFHRTMLEQEFTLSEHALRLNYTDEFKEHGIELKKVDLNSNSFLDSSLKTTLSSVGR